MGEVLAGIVIFCVAFMFGFVMAAPKGYQDETGFHYGEPDER